MMKAALLERARREQARRAQAGSAAPSPDADEPSLGSRAWDAFQDFSDWQYGISSRALEAMSLGVLGDEFRAGIGSVLSQKPYADELARERASEEAYKEDHPVAALTGDVLGSLLGVGAGAKAAGALKKSAKPAIAGLFSNSARGGGSAARRAARGVGKSAAAGAASAGTYSALEGEDGVENRASEGLRGMGIGSILGGATRAAGAGVQKIADNRVARKVISDLVRKAPDDGMAQAKALYGQIDDAGVQIKPEAFDRLRGNMTRSMSDAGMDELPGPGSLTPKSARVNQIAGEMSNSMAQEPTAALPFSSLDRLRRHAGNAAADTQMGRATPDARVGSEAIGQIDDFVRGMTPDDVISGDVQALQELIPKARDAYARASRTRLLDDAVENSENYLSGGASGIRNQFARILRNPKLSRGFSDAEKKLLSRVAKGSIPENILYNAASGIGNLMTIGAGGAMGGVPGMAIGGLGAAGLRKGAEAVAQRNADVARKVVAAGGLKEIPQASESARLMIEALLRRGVATGSAD